MPTVSADEGSSPTSRRHRPAPLFAGGPTTDAIDAIEPDTIGAARAAAVPRRSRLVDGLAERNDELGLRVLAAIEAEIPFYRDLPEAELARVLAICQQHTGFFLRGLRTLTAPSDEELAPARDAAARRAAERVPLDTLLAAYHVGARVTWDALREEARSDEQAELVELASRLIGYLQLLTVTGASAYLEEQQAIYGEERAAQRALAEALLAGTPVEDLPEQMRLRLAPRYLVLVLRMDVPPGDGAAGAVAGRRRVRRTEECLASFYGPAVLSLLSPTGGTVLVPVADVERGDELVAGLQDTVRLLSEAAEAEVLVACAWHPDARRVDRAAQEAGEVVRLGLGLGRRSGVLRLDDVLLEYMITRPIDANGRLLEIVARLSSGPDLVATLEQYFESNFDRRQTAASLHVHPNTLDYRLRRIEELTGLAVGSARGLQLLGAALVARRLT